MTRFAVCGAIYRAIWCLQFRGLRFAVPPRFAVRGLGAYNESGAENRKLPAARRKTPLCLQYRDLRRGTRFAGCFLEMKKSFILQRRRRFGPSKYF